MSDRNDDLTDRFVVALDQLEVPARASFALRGAAPRSSLLAAALAGVGVLLIVLVFLPALGQRAAEPPRTTPAGVAPSAGTATPSARPFPWPCGTVTAYAAPTADASGSVSLGTATFTLARGSGPTNNASLPVGSSLCVNGDQDAAGVFTQFSVSPMGEGICSVVTAYAPPTATAPGSLDFGTPRPPVRISVAAGVTFSPAQVTGDHCFRVTPDAQGTAQVTAYIGPRAGSDRDIFCGVLSANTITSGQGSGPDTFELRPAMSQRTGTISSERLGGWVAGRPPLGTYVCVWLAQRIPIGAFESEVKPGDPGYLRTIVPNGFVLPQTCHYVGQPSSSAADPAVVWRYNCGAEENRDARRALRASFTTQGWVSCASGLGTEVWRKDTSRLTVSESSGAAGETPTLTQRLYYDGGGGPPDAGCP